MRTQKQIAASRDNGRKSHGAATPEGKARIVNANLQSGIFAETQVLTWEHQEELEELKDEYYARHPPASPWHKLRWPRGWVAGGRRVRDRFVCIWRTGPGIRGHGWGGGRLCRLRRRRHRLVGGVGRRDIGPSFCPGRWRPGRTRE